MFAVPALRFVLPSFLSALAVVGCTASAPPCTFDVPEEARGVASSLTNDGPRVPAEWVVGDPPTPKGGKLTSGTYHLTAHRYFYDASAVDPPSHNPDTSEIAQGTMVIDTANMTIADVEFYAGSESRFAYVYSVDGATLNERAAACLGTSPNGPQLTQSLDFTADANELTVITVGEISPGTTGAVIVFTRQSP